MIPTTSADNKPTFQSKLGIKRYLRHLVWSFILCFPGLAQLNAADVSERLSADLKQLETLLKNPADQEEVKSILGQVAANKGKPGCLYFLTSKMMSNQSSKIAPFQQAPWMSSPPPMKG